MFVNPSIFSIYSKTKRKIIFLKYLIILNKHFTLKGLSHCERLMLTDTLL